MSGSEFTWNTGSGFVSGSRLNESGSTTLPTSTSLYSWVRREGVGFMEISFLLLWYLLDGISKRKKRMQMRAHLGQHHGDLGQHHGGRGLKRVQNWISSVRTRFLYCFVREISFGPTPFFYSSVVVLQFFPLSFTVHAFFSVRDNG
jgi:hypothetical protein